MDDCSLQSIVVWQSENHTCKFELLSLWVFLTKTTLVLRLAHNITQGVVLRFCISHVLTLVTTQCDTRIGSDSIHAFFMLHPCIWSQNFGWEFDVFACHKLDAQRNARSSVNLVNQSLVYLHLYQASMQKLLKWVSADLRSYQFKGKFSKHTHRQPHPVPLACYIIVCIVCCE